MAYISQLEDEDDPALLGGPMARPQQAAAPGAPAPQAAAPTPAGSRFVNFSRFLNANRDTVERSADSIVGGLDSQATGIQNDANALKMGAAPPLPGRPEMDLEAPKKFRVQPRVAHRSTSTVADTLGGRVGALQEAAGKAFATPARSRFGAALVGAAGADQFADARQRYGNLSGALRSVDALNDRDFNSAADAYNAESGALEADWNRRAEEFQKRAAAQQVKDQREELERKGKIRRPSSEPIIYRGDR